MKLPRDCSARDVIKSLASYGYTVTRQKGSHIRLTTQQGGEHHVTVPDHDPLRVGTLSNILRDVAVHFGITREALSRKSSETGPERSQRSNGSALIAADEYPRKLTL